MKEKKVTCREIIMFIAKFNLWGAEFGSNLDGITFVMFDGDEVDQTSTICADGYYIVKFWDEDSESWKTAEEGNVFDWH